MLLNGYDDDDDDDEIILSSQLGSSSMPLFLHRQIAGILMGLILNCVMRKPALSVCENKGCIGPGRETSKTGILPKRLI